MIPARFQRLADAFGEFSMISDGSKDSPTDLSDLVNTFLEGEIREQRNNDDDRGEDWNSNCEMESNSESSRELLELLFRGENDAVRIRIHSEVEKAWGEINCRSKNSPPDFKRQLMARLRSGGFDAGICKSKCVKNDCRQFGDYEYIDVNFAGERYIIEVYLAGEFTIACPTGAYAALLENLPPIFVGKPGELRQLVRLMCGAIRKSMKSVGISVAPWRRRGYMQSKWFGSYKRTTSETVSRKGSDIGGAYSNRIVTVNGFSFRCRDEFGSGAGVGIGKLSAVMNK